tara:strand:- start:1376 stop:2002 length:627 start_codon:yes stop_codon:yes gene_type:complete
MNDFIRIPASKNSLANRQLVYGIGINDAYYATQPVDEDGKQTRCPHYQAWRNMLERSYSAKCQKKYPTYIGCSVAKEWHTFSNFLAWSEAQEWQGNALDKDILVQGNKIYGPDTCAYVSRTVNAYFNDRAAARGDLPLGVSLFRGKYMVQVGIAGKQKYLGLFALTDLAGAVRAYKSAKLAQAYVVAKDIANALVRAGFIRQAQSRFA